MDGAMGTMIQNYNLTEEDFRGEYFRDHEFSLRGNNDILVITQPEIIHEIERKYLDAGADIIFTNTFSGTSLGQADYNTEFAVYDLNYQAAKIAKEVAKGWGVRSNRPRSRSYPKIWAASRDASNC